ncbi:E3 ubiquitin-protein ligase TRIM69 [Danio rerio]|uniref:E3 ubiquitin-protein ligase TRIM69 n=1 Tax=Danio rerio TaxID=7955 RepID=A0A8M9PKM7_DANRE|nr:E3 ubiquitin-protein ligase TRIM39 isoform X1 [Danio rerio]|eukprot:XP_021332022.1 E3 ubiquitin-protein ligase TRIM39 isoform X1 [Danio rerio]
MKKSILKANRYEAPEAGLSNSIGAVTWTLPDEGLQAHSSVPSKSSQSPRQKDLKDLRSLQECVKFITQWKQQVDQVCKPGANADEGPGASVLAEPRSLEQCRKLILEWAQELRKVDSLFSEGTWRKERDTSWEQKESQADSAKHMEQKIMEWAKELQAVSERCGVMRQELAQFLKQLELKKRKILTLLPFLEFITWSLLKQDSQGVVPQLWLLSKHRTWKTETPKYIPNSVWRWIRSASVDISLDPMTNHPWLQLSDDKKKVQEALSETEVSFSKQRFDSWPCVLGWEGLTSGRYYWEVDIANKGYWRIGVTTASSKRHGRSPMNPSEGFWTIWKSTRQFYACTKPETELPLTLVPKKLGVYLDYEEGQVSFYNVETRTHIFTFTANFRETLFPLFAPLDGRTLITLSTAEVNPETASL